MVAALVGLMLGAFGESSSAAADPVGPFATIVGMVAAGDSQNFNAAPISGAHPNVVARVAVTSGGPASGLLDYANPVGMTPGSVTWMTTNASYGPGDSPSIYVSELTGTQPVSFVVGYYDLPAAPATYSGVSAHDPANDLDNISELYFTAPGAAQYVADLTLSSGAVTLSGGPSGQMFASSGQYAVGQAAPGQNHITVAPVPGPPAQWSITLRAVPVSVYAAAFGTAFAPAGAIDTLTYTMTGQASLTVTVANSVGQPVRSLATNYGVGPGTQSLVWDGRDGAGRSLPDGTYTATIVSTDPFGNVASAATSLTLDSTPPSVVMASPATIAPAQGVIFRVVDSGSGMSTISLIVDGQDAGDYGGPYGAPLPSGGTFGDAGPWSIGKHSWEIRATDRAGNSADVKGRFTAAVPPPPLPPGVFVHGLYGLGRSPATLTLSSSRVFANLKWSGWGRPNASASGTERIRTRARWSSYRAQVQLSNVQVCGGRRVYTRIRYRIRGRSWVTGHRTGCRVTP